MCRTLVNKSHQFKNNYKETKQELKAKKGLIDSIIKLAALKNAVQKLTDWIEEATNTLQKEVEEKEQEPMLRHQYQIKVLLKIPICIFNIISY